MTACFSGIDVAIIVAAFAIGWMLYDWVVR